MTGPESCEHSPWLSVLLAALYVFACVVMAYAAGALCGVFVLGYRMVLG